jgi:hypothetical protein
MTDTKKLRIEKVTDISGFLKHSEDWENLSGNVSQELQVLAHPWVSAYLETMLNPSESWSCFFAYHGDELVGVLPVIATKDSMMGITMTRLRTPYNSHAPTGDLAIRKGDEEIAVPALLNVLGDHYSNILSISIEGVIEDSPTARVILENRSLGQFVSVEDQHWSFLPTDDNFEVYINGLNNGFQRNLRRLRKKIYKLNNVEFRFLSGKDATEKDLVPFMELEASGWKGRNGTAIRSNRNLMAFYSAFVQRLAGRGLLEWHILSADGKPIAAHLALRLRRSLILSKIAYDEAYSEFAPGNMLFYQTIERAYESKEIQEINCLSDTSWMTNWNMSSRKYFDFTLNLRRPCSFLFGYFPRFVRDTARQVPGVRPLVREIRRISGKTG